jgi:hypothetical protein
MPKLSVDISKFIHRMRALNKVLERPLRDVVNSGARTCAISLAKSTQPDGTGAEAKNQGETAVSRDILKVYGNAGGAFEAISDTQLKKAFWHHYKKGDFKQAIQIAKNAHVPVGKFDGGSLHKTLRGTRRKVIRISKPGLYIIEPNERRKLERYIQFVQRDVGTAKGAWVDCVRVLGGTPRGLRQENDITANWITRKGRGSGAAIKGGSDFNPTTTITNRIPYVRQLLSTSAENYAKGIARDRMIKNLEYAVKAEAKKV